MGFSIGNLFGTNVKAPAARDPAAEGKNMFKAQSELAPQIFGAVDQYSSQYSGLQADQLAGVSSMLQQQNPQLYALYESLGTQAQSQLDSGGYLSPDEVRQVKQDSRSGWNDRGLVRSEPSAYDEVLNLYGARRTRQQENQNFASGVSSLLAGDQQMSLNTANNNLAGLMTMFDPFNAYGADVANTNYNAQAAANIATANNNGALWGSLIGMGGQLGGAGMMAAAMCWVAREVYGADNPQWRMFRRWLLADAPRWFRGLYIAYGPDFARWIANKPRLKAVIRRWMDARIGANRSTEIPEQYKLVVREV